MKKVPLVLIGLFASIFGHAQTITSAQNGPWNEPSTWVGGVVPTDSTTTLINILHEVTVVNGLDIELDQTVIGNGGNLVIEDGAVVTIIPGTGTDIEISGNGQLNVSGTLRFSNGVGFVGISASNTNFLDGSIYEHLYISPGASLPFADWNEGSTLRVTGWTSTGSVNASWSQDFGNVEIDVSVAGTLLFNGLLTSVAGDLIFNNSNVNPLIFQLSMTQSPVISIGGDFTVIGNSGVTLSTTLSSASLTVGGNFSYQSTFNSLAGFNGTGSPVVEIQGNFVLNCASSGGLTVASSSGNATFNLHGDFIFQSGQLVKNSTGGRGVINFVGNGIRQFQRAPTGTAITGIIDFNVSSNTQLDIGTSIIGGNGNFVLNGILALGSTSTAGAIPTQLALIGTKTYNSGTTIIYNGSGAQTANGHPSATNVNVIVNNASGVSISGTSNVTVGGDLTLQTGSLTVSGTSPQLVVDGNLILPSTGGDLIIGINGGLVLNGPVNVFPGKQIQLSASSDLTINGTGSFGVFPFPSGAQQFRNFTLNRGGSGNVTFANDVTLTGTVTLTQGNLVFNNALVLGGTFSTGTGRLFASANPALSIISSGALGTLLFDPSGNTLSSLTMNGSGSAVIGNAISIQSELNLISGALDNQGGITVSNQLVVTRDANCQFFGSVLINAPGDVYDVRYTGSTLVTGIELPADSEDLRNLIIEGGPVGLSQNITVNGNVQLNSGFLNGGVSVITMNGPVWDFNGGEFQSESSFVIFASQTEIQGTAPSFATIELESSADVSIEAQELIITGDLTRDPSAVFDLSQKTISVDGFDSTRISLNGSFVQDINVYKSSAAVRLRSGLNLTGTLDVQTPVAFLSNGFLTLISNSDGPEQNASIGPLLFGAEVIGDVTVQRFMSGEGRIYRYLSSPVTNATIQDWKDYFPITGTFDDPSTGDDILSGNPSLFYYDETLPGGVNGQGWIPYPSSGLASANPIVPGVGYAAFIRVEANLTWELSGEINQGVFDFDITYTDNDSEDADGYNLVGNPYPSTIDWSNSAGWDLTNVGAVIAIRNNGEGGGDFVYSDDEGFPQAGLVATGQAFWILAIGDDPTMSINESAKVGQTGTFYREGVKEFDAIEISLSKGAKVDRTYVRTREGALKTLDRFDGPKLQNDFFSLSVVAEGQSKLALSAVDALACGDVIPLDLRFPVNAQGNFISNPVGTYEFGIKKSGILQPINTVLYDRFTNEIYLIDQNQTVSITISNDPESYASDRFELRILETEPLVDFALATEGILCNATTVNITLSNSQAGVNYFIVINDQPYPVKYSGLGGEMEIKLPENQLQYGVNSLALEVTNLCGSVMHNTVLSVERVPVYSVSESSSTTICNEGSSVLNVIGGVDGSVYNWYESASDIDPIYSTTSTAFQTPTLNVSTTYYVGIQNEKGCEGNRVPVTVSVVSFTPAEIIFEEPNKLISNHESGLAWFFNDVLLPQNQQEIVIQKSGLYRLEVTVDECVSVSEQIFVITSIESSDQSQLEIYPNPAHDMISVRTTSITELQIRNYTGQQVLQVKINSEEDNLLDISHLAPGVYFISGKAMDGRLIVTRIIKL